jgi:uncharacterized membrane protein
MRNNMHAKVKRTTEAAFLAALVAVLQVLAYTVKFGPFNMSLVLVPVVIGGVLLGPGVGAFLGGVFGAVVSIACVTGMDAGGFILFSANPFCCILLCLVKGIAAGYISALVYRVLSGKLKINMLATMLGTILAPVVNTGLFCLGMALFFYDTLVAWAGGSGVIYYMFTGLIGVNFVIELLLNVILCPIISEAVFKYKKKK